MQRGLAASVLAAAALLAGPAGEGPSPADAAASPGRPIRVKGTWPRAGDDTVLTDPVVVRFSAPVDFTTVNSASLRIYRPGAGPDAQRNTPEDPAVTRREAWAHPCWQ